MDSIFSDQLKEEELLSGFELLNTDDDSFLLDNGVEYPGKLPYKLSPDEIKDAEASEKLIKEFLEQQNKEKSQIEENRGTVWNLFEEDEKELLRASQNYKTEENEDLKLGHSFNNENTDGEKFGVEPFDDEEKIENETRVLNNDEEDVVNEKFNSGEEDISNDYLNKEQNEETVSEKYGKEIEEDVKLDDDFLAILQGDLNKSLVRKADSEPTKNIQNEKVIDADFSDFHPVDELEDSVLIEFDSLGVDRPSEFKENENKVRSTPTKKLKPIRQHKEKKQKPVEEKKQKPEKERKKITIPALPWRKFSFVAATIAIFGGIFFLGYYLFFIDPKTQEQINQIKSFKDKKSVKKTDKLKIIPPEEKMVQETPVVQDSVAFAHNNINDSTTKNSGLPSNLVPEKNSGNKISYKEKIINDIKAKKKTIISQKSTQGPKNTNLNNISFNNFEERLYVVEVFSTPIKEEAEKWLLNLHNQKIYDGVIRTQKIRDNILYKVRFGNYLSYEEAKDAVLKSGIKNARIDRIK